VDARRTPEPPGAGPVRPAPSERREVVRALTWALAAALVCLLAVVLLRFLPPVSAEYADDAIMAGHQIAYPCFGNFYARRGSVVVLIAVAHCRSTEGAPVADARGRLLGTWGPLATVDPCKVPGRRCLASDMTYIVLAPDRVPWGRLDRVRMGRSGVRSLAGTRALACTDIAKGDPMEATGVLGYRAGSVLDVGPYLADGDGDHFPCIVLTDTRARVGDSGGPVFVDGQPAGIVSRSFDGRMGFTPLAEGLGALGLELCTTPGCDLTPPSGSASSMTAPSPEPTRAPDAAVPWILFFRYDERQLWRLRPGTDEVELALAGGPEEVSGEADWSPDGGRYAFIGLDADGTKDLWAADWDGTDAARLVDCAPPCAEVGGPAWSPDGRTIAFWRLDVAGDSIAGSSLRAVDVASGAVSKLLESRPPRILALPRWSGDGRRLVAIDAVVSAVTSAAAPELRGASLAIVDLAPSPPAVRRLVDPEMYVGGAAWHPTADLILFSAGALDPFDAQHPTSELYTIRPDGSGLTRITDLESIDGAAFWPAWSPDGSEVLFSLVHRGAGAITLATVRPDGSDLEDLGAADPIVGAFARQRPVETRAPASSTPAP
jgi:hypothetical protein